MKVKKKKSKDPTSDFKGAPPEPTETPLRKFRKAKRLLEPQEKLKKLLAAYNAKIMREEGRERVVAYLKSVLEGAGDTKERLKAAEILAQYFVK